jgi:hypothetical protein
MRALLTDLRDHPLVLALVIINVVFLGAVVREVSASGARKDALIAELARECVGNAGQKGDREK